MILRGSTTFPMTTNPDADGGYQRPMSCRPGCWLGFAGSCVHVGGDVARCSDAPRRRAVLRIAMRIVYRICSADLRFLNRIFKWEPELLS